MTQEEYDLLKEALNIINNKNIDVGLLKNCFKEQEDPFLLKVEPQRCKGLYIYNSNSKCGRYPLTMKEYRFLKEVLK